MAKLNKSEIKAVASKAHRKLTNIAEKQRKEAIKNYKPSNIYTEIVSLAIERDRLRKELESVEEQLRESGKFNYDYWWLYNMSVDEIKNYIIKAECKLKNVPEIEDIEDDVTIACIDKDFNIQAFIDTLIDKFNENPR